MPLIAGAVTITVPVVNPTTGLGTPVLIGIPPAGPNLALELASALLPSTMAPPGAAAAQLFYNTMAAKIVLHIQTNANVTGTAGPFPVVGTIL